MSVSGARKMFRSNHSPHHYRFHVLVSHGVSAV